jgi:hypothetical protein
VALDLLLATTNAEHMAGHAVDRHPSRALITLGRVDVVRVQVGYRADPDGPTYQHFLLDLPVPDSGGGAAEQEAFDERRVLAALEPVLYAGGARPRHYSVHQHRWHTSWGPSPGALEIGLLVTAGTTAAAATVAAREAVVPAFRDLLELAERPAPTPTSRDVAILRARRGAATAYALDPAGLTLSVEEHQPALNSWRVRLRATEGDEYDVQVGFVDGYAGSLWVRHGEHAEVFGSIGSE